MEEVKGCIMKILGERLRVLRKERHLTQHDMADVLDISYRSYRRYEAGEREPNASTVVILADYFNVSADYLLGRTDSP